MATISTTSSGAGSGTTIITTTTTTAIGTASRASRVDVICGGLRDLRARGSVRVRPSVAVLIIGRSAARLDRPFGGFAPRSAVIRRQNTPFHDTTGSEPPSWGGFV